MNLSAYIRELADRIQAGTSNDRDLLRLAMILDEYDRLRQDADDALLRFAQTVTNELTASARQVAEVVLDVLSDDDATNLRRDLAIALAELTDAAAWCPEQRRERLRTLVTAIRDRNGIS